MDLERLHRTHAEDARLERQRLYQDFLGSVSTVEEQARWLRGPTTYAESIEAITVVGRELTKVQLLAAPSVVPAAERLSAVVADFADAVAKLMGEDQEKSTRQILKTALAQTMSDWKAARANLLKVMKEDIDTLPRGESIKSQ
jgi:hypothetical protein